MSQADEQDLLEQCRQGSPGGREKFVRRYGALVRWAIQKTLSESPVSSLDADDLFQDTFIKIFSPGVLEGVRDSGAIKSWLVLLACRTTLDAIRVLSRRLKREAPLGIDGADEFFELQMDPAAVVAEGALDQLTRQEAEAAVTSLIDRLTERERAIVRFYYMSRMTHTKIGEVMGLPKDTVATILRRCRENLRIALERRGHGPK